MQSVFLSIHHVLYSCVIHESDQLKHIMALQKVTEISVTQSEVVDDDQQW